MSDDRYTELERLAEVAAIKTGPEEDWYCDDVLTSDRPVSSPRWAREFTAKATPHQILRLVAIARRYEYLKQHASDRHMWSDESIDAAIAAHSGKTWGAK